MATRSIIMKKMDRGEADETVIFLSRDQGWLTGVAKNSRKSRIRFGGSLEPFCVVDLLVRPRQKDSMVWIDESQMVKGFIRIREDMELLARASYFMELASVFVPEGQKDQELFDFLERFLEILDQSTLSSIEFLVHEIQLLGILGFGPVFDICPVCGQGFGPQMEVFFAPCSGGVCHRRCLDPISSRNVKISRASLAALRHGLNSDSKLAGRIKLSRSARVEIRECLSAFVRHIRGQDLNSLKFMEKTGYY
jgi:DNA repair protein RecO (recombination protein O)